MSNLTRKQRYEGRNGRPETLIACPFSPEKEDSEAEPHPLAEEWYDFGHATERPLGRPLANLPFLL
jgi:hypothetical protein